MGFLAESNVHYIVDTYIYCIHWNEMADSSHSALYIVNQDGFWAILHRSNFMDVQKPVQEKS